MTARRGDSGVTLVEVLVALSIVAVMASASVLALRGGPADTVEAEARKLAARLAFAVDETLAGGRPLRFYHAPNGYRFARRVAGEWRNVESAPLDPYPLPRGIVMAESGMHAIGADGFGAPFDLILNAFPSPSPSAWRVRFDGLNAVAEEI